MLNQKPASCIDQPVFNLTALKAVVAWPLSLALPTGGAFPWGCCRVAREDRGERRLVAHRDSRATTASTARALIALSDVDEMRSIVPMPQPLGHTLDARMVAQEGRVNRNCVKAEAVGIGTEARGRPCPNVLHQVIGRPAAGALRVAFTQPFVVGSGQDQVTVRLGQAAGFGQQGRQRIIVQMLDNLNAEGRAGNAGWELGGVRRRASEAWPSSEAFSCCGDAGRGLVQSVGVMPALDQMPDQSASAASKIDGGSDRDAPTDISEKRMPYLLGEILLAGVGGAVEIPEALDAFWRPVQTVRSKRHGRPSTAIQDLRGRAQSRLEWQGRRRESGQ